MAGPPEHELSGHALAASKGVAVVIPLAFLQPAPQHLPALGILHAVNGVQHLAHVESARTQTGP